MKTIEHDPSYKYVILISKSQGTRFFTMNDENDPRITSDGTREYEIIGYANKVRDAQIILYGFSSCDHDD